MYETMGERGKIWAYSVEFCTKTGGIGFGPKAVVFQPLLESLTMPSSGSFQSLWKAGHCDVGSLPWGRRPGPRLCLHLVQSRCQSPNQDLEGSWGPAPSPTCVHHLSDLSSTGSPCGSQHASYLFSLQGLAPCCFPCLEHISLKPMRAAPSLPSRALSDCHLLCRTLLHLPHYPYSLPLWLGFIFLHVTHQHLLSHIHTPFKNKLHIFRTVVDFQKKCREGTYIR